MTARPLRLAILNYADVRNFGDVLFPLVVARELGIRIPNAEIHFVTPTGSSWAGMESVRFDRAEIASYDAIVLGGGEIVHRLDDMLIGIYRRFGLECIERPTDLVFAWTAAPSFKAWLSLGVPEPSAEARRDIDDAVPTLNYVSARGSLSAARLSQSGSSNPVMRTPDLGWLFPRLLRGRAPPVHPAGGAPYLALQALGFRNIDATLASLRRVSQTTGLRIVLVPLTRCWEDVRPLSMLHQASDGEFFLVDDDTPDIDKLALLGGATVFAGQSMHGLIGSLSQGHPGGICLPEADDKFGELLRDLGLQQFRRNDWDEIESLVQTLLWSPLGLVAERRKSAESQLDAAFDELADRIQSAAPANETISS
jgi:polysaccharide pyruvyl transferase WcaK-like protein